MWNRISRDKGVGEEDNDKKMAAADAIERMRAAPGEEKCGEAWSREGRQSAELRGQSVGAMEIALQEGGNYQQEVAEKTRSGCTHDVLKGLPGRRCAVEMRDGERKGGCRAAATGVPDCAPETGLVLLLSGWNTRRIRRTASGSRRVILVTGRGMIGRSPVTYADYDSVSRDIYG